MMKEVTKTFAVAFLYVHEVDVRVAQFDRSIFRPVNAKKRVVSNGISRNHGTMKTLRKVGKVKYLYPL